MPGPEGDPSIPKAPNGAPYRPLIIVGAPRSGTNMFRDVLSGLPGFGTWPCDEINYIWRYGNALHPTDELSPELARPRVCRYIRRAFAARARKQSLSWVVEKTCANSLRVAFVDRAVPEATYLYIVRDGRDALASAVKRWKAEMNWSYVWKKARFVPFLDVPYYASRYVGTRIYKLFSREKRLSVWGPRFEGMLEMARTHSLPEVCAAQWARCVDSAERDFERLDAARVFRIRYESLVADPAKELGRLCSFLQVEVPPDRMAEIAKGIRVENIGKWKTDLDGPTIEKVMPLVEATLRRHGYE